MNEMNQHTHHSFPVQSTILSSAALLEKIVSRYPLEAPLECFLYSEHLNHVYRVKSNSSPYYLRVSRFEWRTPRDIEEEIDLLLFLHSHNVPVALPLKSKDDRYYYVINAPEGERCAVLFHNAEGRLLNYSDKKQDYIFGKLSGKMHNVMDISEKKYHREHLGLDYLLDEPLSRIAQVMKHRPDDIRFLSEISREVKRRLEYLPKTKPIFGICHGDLNLKNVYFKDSVKPTLFDFDCFGCGWRAFDIGVFLYSLVQTHELSSNRVKWMEAFNEFLAGYNEERILNNDEYKAIKLFGLIRYIWGYGISILFVKHRGVRLVQDEAYLDENMRIIKDFARVIL